jgi:hypothetical protein
MRKSSELNNATPDHSDRTGVGGRSERLIPLAGVGFAVLTLVGDLTIGQFPDSDTPTSKLSVFYAAHHAQVSRGGTMLGWAGILLAFFGLAMWARIRAAGLHPVLAGAALVGTAIASLAALFDASTYVTLGAIGAKQSTSLGALQAWHIEGSEGNLMDSGGTLILLLAIAAAGIFARAFPRWISWTALVIAVAQYTPVGFVASLILLLWSLVVGITLAVRPLRTTDASARSAAASYETATRQQSPALSNS